MNDSNILTILTILIKFMLRCVLLLVSWFPMGASAFAELMSQDADWSFWRPYNSFFLKNLPWSKY